MRSRPRRGIASAACSGRAFTLVELLVVIAIIALLLSILTPTLNRARSTTRRATDVASTHMFLQAVHSYSSAYRTWFPNACRETTAGPDVGYGHDDMVAFRYSSWAVLRDQYGLTTANSTCISFDWQAPAYGKYDGTTYGGTVIGRIIWGGRRDTFYPESPYKTPKRAGDTGTSNTYMTCREFVRAPTWANGQVPHVGGDNWAYTDCGITTPYDFQPTPDGMTVGLTDGGGGWYAWKSLLAVKNHNWLFYAPRPDDPQYKK